jgi:hypothetical protein
MTNEESFRCAHSGNGSFPRTPTPGGPEWRKAARLRAAEQAAERAKVEAEQAAERKAMDETPAATIRRVMATHNLSVSEAEEYCWKYFWS